MTANPLGPMTGTFHPPTDVKYDKKIDFEDILTKLKQCPSKYEFYYNTIVDAATFEAFRYTNKTSFQKYDIESVKKYIMQEFNLHYFPPASHIKPFSEWLISMALSQNSPWQHPLTCGVDSTHALLVPRVDVVTKECYIICPTCGYTQRYNYAN